MKFCIIITSIDIHYLLVSTRCHIINCYAQCCRSAAAANDCYKIISSVILIYSTFIKIAGMLRCQ